jgi:hypothetical protein
MARKTQIVKISFPGRDTGKAFLLTEMPATQGEKWGMRALLALMHGGVTIPPEIADMGLAGVAHMGAEALAGLPFELAEPLLDEMFQCIRYIPNPDDPNIVRSLVESDIEEIKTRLFLRKEVLVMHLDFFTDADLWKRAQAATLTKSAD